MIRTLTNQVTLTATGLVRILTKAEGFTIHSLEKMCTTPAAAEQPHIIVRCLSSNLKNLLMKARYFHLCGFIQTLRAVPRKMTDKETEKESIPVQRGVKPK